MKVAVVPLTVHTPVVVEANDTVNPELAVADKVNGVPTVCAPGFANVIACEAGLEGGGVVPPPPHPARTRRTIDNRIELVFKAVLPRLFIISDISDSSPYNKKALGICHGSTLENQSSWKEIAYSH